MKILIIYYLEDKGESEFFQKFGEQLKEVTKCDAVVSFENVNQLEGVQYPYFVIKEY